MRQVTCPKCQKVNFLKDKSALEMDFTKYVSTPNSGAEYHGEQIRCGSCKTTFLAKPQEVEEAMLIAHLQAGERILSWVYGQTRGPNILLKFLLAFFQVDLSKCFLLGLTEDRFLLVRTAERLAGQPLKELGFQSIPFANIKNASVEDSGDPWNVGSFSSKMSGQILHFQFQDGKNLSLGVTYLLPSFPSHKENLESIASFVATLPRTNAESLE